MKTIYLKNIVPDTYTNSADYTLYLALKDYVTKNKNVALSFKGASPTSSSFLNSSFGQLLDDFDFDKIKYTIKLTELSKSEASILKEYFLSCGVKY